MNPNETGKLAGKVALVTGGSSGIGKAIAQTLALEGASVAVVASRSLEKAACVAEAIANCGGDARPFVADVRSVSEVKHLVQSVVSTYKTVDILVNSAGLYYQTTVGETSEDQYDCMIDTNFKGLYFVINTVAPIMKRNGGGKIINVSSVAAFVGRKNYALYCAIKAAVVMLTRTLALELAPYGINVNAIAPGSTLTPINEHIRTDPEFAEERARIHQMTPSSRKFSPPEDIARAALFLATDDSLPMHGSTMLLDEGRSAGW